MAVMVSLWQRSSHQHGWLVIPISAYLVWRLWPGLQNVGMRGEPWGVVAVAILVTIWLLSRLAGVQVIEHASVLALMPATIFAVAGRRFAYKLLFPLSFLMCAVPIGDSLVPYLMSITADVSAAMLRLSGVPMLRDGPQITLPGGSFVVAKVCSGVRYLMSGMIIAILYSYLNFRSNVKRLTFLLFAGVLLVFANGLRAFLIMTIASASDMRYLVGADHIFFGWALFGIVMISIMSVAARYADHPNETGSELSSNNLIDGDTGGLPFLVVLVLAMIAAILNPLQSEALSVGKLIFGLIILIAAIMLVVHHKRGAEIERRNERESVESRDLRSISIAALVAILLVSGPQAFSVLENHANSIAAVPSIAEFEHCDRRASWSERWYPENSDVDIEAASTHFCIDGEVSIYVAGYASALQGAELISSSNRLTPVSWARHSKRSSREFSMQDGSSRRVNELWVDTPGYRGLVWYWYEVDSQSVTGEVAAKALQVWALLRGRPAGGHVVLVSTAITGNKEAARRRLEVVSIQLIDAELQRESSDPA